MTRQVKKPKYIHSCRGVSAGSHTHGSNLLHGSRLLHGSNSTGSQKYQHVVTQVTVNKVMDEESIGSATAVEW
jgi:hypothetical protein